MSKNPSYEELEQRVKGLEKEAIGRKRTEKYVEELNRLKEGLLGTGDLNEKLKRITDGIVKIFGADFARIWVIDKGDQCDNGCFHATATEGPHVCRFREKCLHLKASSGRYTHIDGSHGRVPFGCYKIGRVAAEEDPKFLTNNVTTDPRIHDHQWAKSFNLTAFAGYRMLSGEGKPIGVLALFSRQAIGADEDVLLESLANASAQVVQTGVMEAALKESEKKYRLLVQNMPGIVYKGYKDWSVEFFDKKIESVTGYAADEFNSRNLKWSDIIYEPDPGTLSKIFIQALKADKSYIREYQIISKSGSVHWIRERGQIICDSKGEVDYINGVFFDITDHIQSQEALRESEATLKSIFRAAPTGIGMVADRIIKQANELLCEITGYSRDELLEKSARMLYPTDEDFEYVGQEKYKQISERGTGTVETRWQRKDGKVIDVLLSSTPIDPNDLSLGVTFTALDISERKRTEEELLKYRVHLEEMVELRTTELAKTNQQLIQNIKEQKQAEVELKKRSDELRTMVNLMAGREMRMAELKKVIEKLHAQIESEGLTPVAVDPLKEVGKDYT